MKAQTGVVILAGGRSERMKYPKCYLQIRGQTFAEAIATAYADAGFPAVGLVIRREYTSGEWEQHFQTVMTRLAFAHILDTDAGRFYSVRSGLTTFADADFCFIHNVDNPVISTTTIQTLWQNRAMNGYTECRHKGRGGHPILLSRPVIHLIIEMKQTECNLRDVLRGFAKNTVNVDSADVLRNINTADDYRHLVDSYNP